MRKEGKMKRKIVTIALFMMFLSALLPSRGIPCIGRILSLGITDTGDQMVMAEMLSALIGESTGTKVNIVRFKTLDECREAIKNKELDLYLDYVCSGLIHVLSGKKVGIENPGKAYSMVKHLSDKQFSLIWLKPFGYDDPSTLKEVELKDIPNRAVCVARRDVLNRFPVLPRLINKLHDKVPNEVMGELQQSKDVKVEVRKFLEERKMIRWAIQ